MFCKYCGKQIHDDAVFCKYCGGSIASNKAESIENNGESELDTCSLATQKATEEEQAQESSPEHVLSSDVQENIQPPNKKTSFYKWIVAALVFIVGVILVGVLIGLIKGNSKNKDTNVSLDPVEEEITETSNVHETDMPSDESGSEDIKQVSDGENSVDKSDEELDESSPNDANKYANLYQQFMNDQITVEGKKYKDYLPDFGPAATNYYYDVDDDGINEFLIGSVYGFDIFDVKDDNIFRLAYGGGTADICSVYKGNDHTYVGHSDFSHAGRQFLNLIRYDSEGKEVESIDLNAEYWDSPDDQYDETSDFTFNGNRISQQEYEHYMNTYVKVSEDEMEIATLENAGYAGNTADTDVISAYADYFKKKYPPTEYGSYLVAFAYLDTDDIPEMLVMEDFDMGLVNVLQYDSGKIDDLGWYESLGYVPNKNDIVYSCSDGETSEDVQYMIENHKFKAIGGVSAVYGDDDMMHYYIIDKNGTKTETSEKDYKEFYKKQRMYGVYTSTGDIKFYSSVEEAKQNIQ